MKNLKKSVGVWLLAAFVLIGVSCDNNDEIIVDPNADFDAVLDVKESGPANPNADVTVDANTASTIKAKVTFTTTTKDMARLYITQNIKGAGETIYKPTEAIDLKGDGAIDLTGKNSKNFEFQFALPVPAGVGTTGTVVYNFWTTTGNGDFRDKTQRLALGTGTITLKFGAATNPDAALKSFTNIELRAPLADGTSLTFMSFFDGKTYKIKTGTTPAANAEFVALWDMGYYYRTNPSFLWEATLSSTGEYLDAIVNIPTLSGIAKADLNKVYFKKGSTLDFATVATTSSLNAITASTAQYVTNLKVGDIVEFVNEYGKKGLIKVTAVTAGDGATGVIKIDIKVQP